MTMWHSDLIEVDGKGSRFEIRNALYGMPLAEVVVTPGIDTSLVAKMAAADDLLEACVLADRYVLLMLESLGESGSAADAGQEIELHHKLMDAIRKAGGAS
ncbi:MAG: hypothetical protein KDJ47_05895 [Hyphomicrobiaceae bacterium]|nr:hypothetical protein [Hyphomicrobiaceae bacterium]